MLRQSCLLAAKRLCVPDIGRSVTQIVEKVLKCRVLKAAPGPLDTLGNTLSSRSSGVVTLLRERGREGGGEEGNGERKGEREMGRERG